MVWRSAYEPIERGEETFHATIAATAREMGDHVALIDGPSRATISCAELAARIERAAAGLAGRSHRPARRTMGRGAHLLRGTAQVRLGPTGPL